MLTILHASDLHFGAPHDPAASEALLRAIRDEPPGLLVLSGDFTQRAKVREYEAARGWLERLPEGIPTVVTPGNHDVPLYRVAERLFDPFRNYRRWISPDLDTVTRVAGAVVVSLNSAAPRRAITNGRIDPHQIRFAEEAFGSAAPGEARIAVIHHHLAPAPDYLRDHPLPRAASILRAFELMGVDLILSGHLHRAYIGNSLDVFGGNGRPRGVVISHSGTTTSSRGRARERARQSFNRIRVTAERIEITHHMRFPPSGSFLPVSTHAFPRAPRLWFDEAMRPEDGG